MNGKVIAVAALAAHAFSKASRERVRLLEELKTATQMDAGPMLLQARLD